MTTNNPGKTMATAVDSEIASFQMLQSELQQLRSDQQVLLSQQNENEMVKQELCLLDDDTSVYKMVGPVLMSQPVDDAKSTVDKRLEFIGGELKKVEAKIEKAEKSSQEIAEKIQKMQGAMQQAAAEAARVVAAEK